MSRQEFSKSTKLTAFQRSNGYCENPECRTRLYAGKYEYHHDRECAFGGDNSVDNILVLCIGCHRAITSQQAAVIAKTGRVRNRHIGIKKPRTFRGWKRMNGDAVYADRERQ